MRNRRLFVYAIIALFYQPVFLFAQTPSNDILCNSISLVVDASCNKSTNGNLLSATREPNEPLGNCLENESGTIWYHFIAPDAGMVIISTNHPYGNASDTGLALYGNPGGACGDLSALTEIACNKDENRSLSFHKSTLKATVTPGDTFYIQVQLGEQAIATNSDQNFCITVESVDIPFNDDPENAVFVPVEDTLKVFYNLLAGTKGPEEQAIAPEIAQSGSREGWLETSIRHSVWFKFEVPKSGVVEINTFDVFAIFNGNINTTFNTQLAVYRAGDPSDFASYELLGSNDDVFSTLAGVKLSCLTPGDTLYIMVDGSPLTLDEGIEETGKFLLDIREIKTRNMTLTATTSSPVCEDSDNGSILTRVSGGVGPYRYLWNTGETTPGLIRALPAGTYTLRVTDQCDSILNETIEVLPPESLTVDAGNDTALCEGSDAPVTLNPVITGGTRLDMDRIYSVDYDTRRDSNIMVRFPFTQTSQVDTLYQVVPEDFRNFRMTLHDGRLIAVSLGSNAWFEIDPVTELITIIDTLPPLENEFWQGIACHPEGNRLYAISGGVDKDGTPFGNLYELNIDDPDVTLNSSFEGIAPQWLAIDTLGNFYTSDFFSGNLIELYPRSQNYKEVGKLNLAPEMIEDAAFDPSYNQLYLISNSDEGAELWKINTNSAFAMDEGKILGTNTLTGFAIMEDTLSYQLEYSWETPDEFITPSSLTQVVHPDTTTHYILAVTDACGATTRDTVTIAVASNPEITLESLPDQGSRNGAVSATVSGGTPPYEYSWSNGATTDSIAELDSGTYSVMIIDALGCSDNASTEVPLEINTNIARMLEAGITSFLLFPNPARQSIMVELSLQRTDALSIYLYDLNGETLHREDYTQVSTVSHMIPLENLPSGMYIVQVKTTRGYTAERFALD